MAYLLKFLDIFRWKKIYGFYKRKDEQDHE